jgi:hypothetical protein
VTEEIEKRIENLRKKMLEYEMFSTRNKEEIEEASLPELVYLVRKEMRSQADEYEKKRADPKFSVSYTKLTGIHGLALSIALEAGLYKSTGKIIKLDRQTATDRKREAKKTAAEP